MSPKVYPWVDSVPTGSGLCQQGDKWAVWWTDGEGALHTSAPMPYPLALVVALAETPDSDTDELFHWLDNARQLDPPGSYTATKWIALEGLAHRRVGYLRSTIRHTGRW